jgi:hypothetical protein
MEKNFSGEANSRLVGEQMPHSTGSFCQQPRNDPYLQPDESYQVLKHYFLKNIYASVFQ